MKALEKDRTRRYESANGFAADVLRYLAGEPVLAHPPSAGYRLRKFVRRHRGVVIAASLVALALILGIIGTTWGLFEAKRAAHEERLAKENADRKRREAEEQTALTLAIKNFLQHDVLRLADPGTQQQAQLDGLKYDAELKLRDVVIRAAEAIEGKFPDQPLVEAELRATLGFTLRGMGRADLAMLQHQRVRELNTKALGPDDPATLKSMQTLAISYALQGRHEDARKLFEETMILNKKKLGIDHPSTLSSMNNLANSYTALGRYEEMLKLRLETLALMKQKLGPDDPDTLKCMSNLASGYEFMGKEIEALKLREETLALSKLKLGQDHPETLRSMNNLSNSYDTQGRKAEALKLREETLALQRLKLGPDHPDTMSSMHNLANSYATLGRQAEALTLRQETLNMRKKNLGPHHPATLMSMYNLALSYAALGQLEEALQLQEETLKLQKQHLGLTHPHTLSSMYSLASNYAALERNAEALTILEETVKLQKQKLGVDHPDTLYSMRGAIAALMKLQRDREALLKIDEVLALANKAAAAGKQLDASLLPKVLSYRFTILHRQGDVAGCQVTIQQHEKLPLSEPEQFFQAACHRSQLAGLIKTQPAEAKGEADQAMAWLQKAVAAGYQDRAALEKDDSLTPLRDREDFRKLIASLPSSGKKR
ncbi:MAG: tetratricopeptide repeat protein [Gemmatales bacterium]